MRRTSSLFSLLKGVTAALLALSLIAGEVRAAGLDNNATSINGTWSSGSGGVTTGIVSVKRCWCQNGNEGRRLCLLFIT